MTAPKTQSRKPYETPTLRVFGDLVQLTQVIANQGMTDGGTMTMQKTQ